jgi:hypothetical protein
LSSPETVGSQSKPLSDTDRKSSFLLRLDMSGIIVPVEARGLAIYVLRSNGALARHA